MTLVSVVALPAFEHRGFVAGFEGVNVQAVAGSVQGLSREIARGGGLQVVEDFGVMLKSLSERDLAYI